jgi:hypothetical protein
MKVCDCRNIYDTEPNWKSRVMADDFKCGLCQMRLLSHEDDDEENTDDIPDGSIVLEEFLKQANKK